MHIWASNFDVKKGFCRLCQSGWRRRRWPSSRRTSTEEEWVLSHPKRGLNQPTLFLFSLQSWWSPHVSFFYIHLNHISFIYFYCYFSKRMAIETGTSLCNLRFTSFNAIDIVFHIIIPLVYIKYW